MRCASAQAEIRRAAAEKICHDNDAIANINAVGGSTDFCLLGLAVMVRFYRNRRKARLLSHDMLHGRKIFLRQSTMCYEYDPDQSGLTFNDRRSISRCLIATCCPPSARAFATASAVATDLC